LAKLPFGRRRRARAGEHLESFADFLKQETTGGKLLLAATAVALLWANLAPGTYGAVWDTHLGVGPDWLHLHLSVADWVVDGLLAVFFLVAGLELKRELVVGELADRRAAMLPLAAAAGGMLLPALVALVASRGAAADGGAWAIPVATDIAFALGVLALAGSALPVGVRVLLLSMAVVDDLGAIGLIAALFTDDLAFGWLAGAAAVSVAYWYTQRRRWNHPAVLIALGVLLWVCVHASGVHATVAGIVLGVLTPVRTRPGEDTAPAERMERRLHPFSAGFVVPVFALAAAGIPVTAIGGALGEPLVHGVAAGLLVGKTVGILGFAWLAVRLGLGALPRDVTWADVLPVAVLGGVGYTVSLLIARLSVDDRVLREQAALAVLAASVVASLVAVVLLRRRTRSHRRRQPA
jgi:Na+:H+ antiporter, NhaA family